jgi:hypothetical protein
VKLLKLGFTEGETFKIKFAATTWFCVNTVPAWFHDSVSHWETLTGDQVFVVKLSCSLELPKFLTHKVMFELPPEYIEPKFKEVKIKVQALLE